MANFPVARSICSQAHDLHSQLNFYVKVMARLRTAQSPIGVNLLPIPQKSNYRLRPCAKFNRSLVEWISDRVLFLYYIFHQVMTGLSLALVRSCPTPKGNQTSLSSAVNVKTFSNASIRGVSQLPSIFSLSLSIFLPTAPHRCPSQHPPLVEAPSSLRPDLVPALGIGRRLCLPKPKSLRIWAPPSSHTAHSLSSSGSGGPASG